MSSGWFPAKMHTLGLPSGVVQPGSTPLMVSTWKVFPRVFFGCPVGDFRPKCIPWDSRRVSSTRCHSQVSTPLMVSVGDFRPKCISWQSRRVSSSQVSTPLMVPSWKVFPGCSSGVQWVISGQNTYPGIPVGCRPARCHSQVSTPLTTPLTLLVTGSWLPLLVARGVV